MVSPRFPFQFQQCLILLVIFTIGKITAHVYLGWMGVVGWLLYAGVVEHGFLFLKKGAITYPSFSALSTTLGVALMLVASPGWIYGVVLLAALAQKHWLTVDARHFFNPSNFALMTGMLLFYDRAHIVLGQLGEEGWLQVVVVVLAVWILSRVDRWRIPVAFIVGYPVLQYLVLVGYDPVLTFETIEERFYSVAFIVFVVFMLTDPRTTPSRPWQQVLFGIIVAAIATWLDRRHGFRVQHLFMVLFVLSPMVPMLDRAVSDRRRLVVTALLLTSMAVAVAGIIESRPPYYFAMEG